MNKIVLKHWTEGGTVVTNFTEDQDVYEEAVKEFGDSDLIISDPSSPHQPGARALHDLSKLRGPRRPMGLSAFWELWRLIKADKQFSESEEAKRC